MAQVCTLQTAGPQLGGHRWVVYKIASHCLRVLSPGIGYERMTFLFLMTGRQKYHSQKSDS